MRFGLGIMLVFCFPFVWSNDTDSDGVSDDQDVCPEFRGSSSKELQAGESRDISRIEFCSTSISGIPTLRFEVYVSDFFSNTRSIQLLFWFVNNQQTWVTLTREDEEQPFKLDWTLDQQAAAGTYAIRVIRLTDNRGNELALDGGQIESLGFSRSIVLVNDQADNIAPMLSSLSSEGWYFDNEGTPRIDFALSVNESGSGIATGESVLELFSPTGASIFSDRFNFDSQNQTTLSITVSKYSASGDYKVNTVRLYDFAGNESVSQSWLAQNPRVYALANPNSDSQMPSLNFFQLSAYLDDESDRPIIQVNGQSSDATSGVNSVYLRLLRPEGGNLDKWVSYLYEESEKEHEFSNEIALPTIYTSGKYRVSYVRLIDLAKNEIHFSESDLIALSNNSSSFINVYFPSQEEIDAGKSSVTASEADDYVIGSNAANDVLSGGGGNDVIEAGDGDDYLSSGAGNDSVKAGAGSDVIVGGSGEGDDFYDGGSGEDSITYASANLPLDIDLSAGKVSGLEVGNDRLTNIEKIRGGGGNDVFRKNGAPKISKVPRGR